MNAADRERIVDMLLEEPPPSCRAVSRATGYSDWTVRKIARELDGDTRPMRQPRSRSQEPADEVSALGAWLLFGGTVAVIALSIWAGVRSAPPPPSPDSTDSSLHSYDDRKEHDET